MRSVRNLCGATSVFRAAVGLAEWRGATAKPDSGRLAGDLGNRLGPGRGGNRQNLFHLVPPTAMVWLRLLTSAVILLVVARPRLTGHSGRDWLIVLGFGVSLMTMNWAIYQSFARIPLGIAVTIEFLGPLTVAVIGSRRFTDLIWVVLAGAGVALLGVSRASLTLAGVGFALLAAVAWAFTSC